MSLKKDFREFVFRGNVVDLAIAVVIGAAFGKIVSAAVSDLVMQKTVHWPRHSTTQLLTLTQLILLLGPARTPERSALPAV